MKRMVDDKEIREFDNRITALEDEAGRTYTAGNGIDISANNEISVDSGKVIMTSGNQGFISGYKSFQEVGNDNKVTIYPSTGSIFLVNGTTNRSTSYKTDGIECSGGTNSTPSNFAIVNYYSGGYGRHEFDRTEQGTVATRDYVSNAISTGVTTYTAGSNITFTDNGSGGYDINSTVTATINSLDDYKITLSDRYIYTFKDVPNYDITPTGIAAIRLIPTYSPIIDKVGHKTGYLEQGGT